MLYHSSKPSSTHFTQLALLVKRQWADKPSAIVLCGVKTSPMNTKGIQFIQNMKELNILRKKNNINYQGTRINKKKICALIQGRLIIECSP